MLYTVPAARLFCICTFPKFNSLDVFPVFVCCVWISSFGGAGSGNAPASHLNVGHPRPISGIS
nr:MAG TPA: hypothetical protein [Caudoviricetes sp.]